MKRRFVTGAALLGLVALLAACGGGSSSSASSASQGHNEEVVEHAEGKDKSKEEVAAELDRKFSFSKGMEVPLSWELGTEEFCDIEQIYLGKEEVETHAKGGAVLISPDEEEALRVGRYEGTSEADCLRYVNDALEW
jgi:hypothetical protein